ncbi:hypothetical protein [Actinocatenispora comari]|jgi:hypothetical protein|nr:hypothetical protein [Actinocatenispora comari]
MTNPCTPSIHLSTVGPARDRMQAVEMHTPVGECSLGRLWQMVPGRYTVLPIGCPVATPLLADPQPLIGWLIDRLRHPDRAAAMARRWADAVNGPSPWAEYLRAEAARLDSTIPHTHQAVDDGRGRKESHR